MRECINYINGKIDLDLSSVLYKNTSIQEEKYEEDFGDVKGNYFVKRGLEIAAAGITMLC